MIRPKAIKKERTSKVFGRYPALRSIWAWWVQTRSYDAYLAVKRFLYRVKRLFDWVPLLWNNHDFDSHSIYPLLRYKLERLRRRLEKGFAVQNETHTKALRLAIKLANRIELDAYEDVFYKRHDKKWGELKFWFEPVPDKNYNTLRSSRANVTTRETKEQEAKERYAGVQSANARRLREKQWLFSIIAKYDRHWWD